MSQTLFTTQVPDNADATDGVSYELGMKFQSSSPGTIDAIRYWKAASDTGTHVGKIWADTGGTPLATVTFTNETASGWQEQALSTPLSIETNTTYVVSVNISSHFPITRQGLASSVVNEDLSSVADGNNGLFSDANQPGTFPTNSFQNSNYFRDVVFTAEEEMSQTLFTTQVPDNEDATDGVSYELGMKFQSSSLGTINAIRYWKAPSDTGTHVGNIWSSAGTLLATTTFTNETASGWQEQALSIPVSIQANTTYVVSVNISSHFPITRQGLASSVVNGDLSSVADGNNGLFSNANQPGTFPTNSFQNSNYFRDIVFVAGGTPTNAIFLENQNPGTRDWQITNLARNIEIAGYAGATSVNRGESLPLKISLAQPGQYTIEVYRLGFYGGQGGRLMFSSGLLNGVTQPACVITDQDTRLIECNWSTSFTLNVGADWTTGVYLAKLTDQTTTKETEIWFVVRDDSSTSDILFQSCFANYQAYNSFGSNWPLDGYSLYGHNSADGQSAFKVSFDRPFAQLHYNSNNYNNIRRWEYNMLRWLESQSYDISYITSLDVHTNPQFMQNHQVFLSPGHDEYWSQEMRNYAEQARDDNQNPKNLAFFSANTAYWRVRFENSSTGEPNRVMVCYKEAWQLDQVAPTNKFRSPQNNRPESLLLGVMYIGYAPPVYGGFDFTVINSADPYYANTNLVDGDTLDRLVGYEWDRINANASPNGLVELSRSITNQTVQDQEGFPPGTDPNISSAVRYTAASGGKVFSTGSIQWMWGLDSDLVPNPREDLRAQQIAVNVLADMGARPLTPSPNIIVP